MTALRIQALPPWVKLPPPPPNPLLEALSHERDQRIAQSASRTMINGLNFNPYAIDPLKQLVNSLSGALKGLRLYPVQHPLIQKQLQNVTGLLKNLLQGRVKLRIGILQDTLFVNDHLFADPYPAAESLCRLFQKSN